MASKYDEYLEEENWREYLDEPTFAEALAKVDFIVAPLDFLHKTIYDVDDRATNVYLEMIYEHNEKIKASLVNEKKHLLQMINSTNSFTEEVKKPAVQTVEEKQTVAYSDLTSEASRLITYKDVEEQKKQLRSIPQDKIENLKFAIFIIIKEIELTIKKTLLHNKTASITSLQHQIESYRHLLSLINSVEIKEETPTINQETANKYNLIFLPDSKNGTYLYGDIALYSERFKEIKSTLDKVASSYFLSTHDIENLRGEYSNLWEYKNKTGIRILYLIVNNNIIITSLFFKDKQKSTKISAYYAEAIRRFNKGKDYVLQNVNNPNFLIEQKELLGDIFNLLESQKSKSLTLKAGE